MIYSIQIFKVSNFQSFKIPSSQDSKIPRSQESQAFQISKLQVPEKHFSEITIGFLICLKQVGIFKFTNKGS